MAGRVYVAVDEGQSISVGMDIMAILPVSGHDVIIRSVKWTQSSDYGDAQAEGIRFSQVRGNTTVGSGGSTNTPAPLIPGQNAFGGTVRVRDTTGASSGTAVNIEGEGVNVQSGYRDLPVPEELAQVAAGTWWCLRLLASPVDALVGTTVVKFEELN
jgi:hypothetical protein